MSDLIDISDLSKAAVLAALYNASSPAGMGFLQAGNGPQVMDEQYAQELIDKGSDASGDYHPGMAKLRGNNVYFDYLHGRPLKLNLRDDSFNPAGFDRDNGGDGAAQQIINELRASGQVNTDPIKSAHSANADSKLASGLAMAFGAGDPELSKVLTDAVMAQRRRDILSDLELPAAPEFKTGRQYLDWASDQALEYFDQSVDTCIAVFLELVTRDRRTAWIATATLTPVILADGIHSRDYMGYMMKGFAA